jgi:hypothetical protein
VTPEEARNLLKATIGDEEPVFLPPAVLKDLKIDDLPEDVPLEIGTQKDNMIQVDWDGTIINAGGKLQAFARHLHTENGNQGVAPRHAGGHFDCAP